MMKPKNTNQDYTNFKNNTNQNKYNYNNYKNYNTQNNDKYGINILTNKEDVVKKCKELKFKYHPDKNIGEENKYTKLFQEIASICDKKIASFR